MRPGRRRKSIFYLTYSRLSEFWNYVFFAFEIILRISVEQGWQLSVVITVLIDN